MPRGRPLTASPDEIERVLELAAQGMSRRKVAETVFGDARYRGRVERILKREVFAAARDDLHDASARARASVEEPNELQLVRELLDRHRRRLAEADLPSLKEIELLLRLERRVKAAETVEFARALTRQG